MNMQQKIQTLAGRLRNRNERSVMVLTKPLFDKVSSTEKELITLPGSHFAMAIGQKAVSDLWPRELDWLARHSQFG
jgi:hypothetical protein